MKPNFLKTDFMSKVAAIICWSFTVLLVACGRNSGSPTTAIQSSSLDTTPPVQDHSLVSDKYIELGLPSYDRDWNGTDMAAALKSLQALAASHPDQLPRFESPNSGKMFARIISQQNLDLYRNKSLPLNLRLSDMILYMESISKISLLYINAFQNKNASYDEVFEFEGAELKMSQVCMELVDEFVPTISKDDPAYSPRMKGLEQIKNGLTNMVAGSIQSLGESKNCPTAIRAKLLKYCRETFPHIVPELTSASQTEVLTRLNTLAGQQDLHDLQPDLVKLHDEVNAAINAAKAN